MPTKPKKRPKKRDVSVVLDDTGFSAANLDIDLETIHGMIEDIDDLPLYLKILIFGEQGTGKTTCGGTMPGPILFVDCNEEGTKSVRGTNSKRIRIRTWEQFEGIYWYLRTQKHPFKSVVIDTTTQLADIGMSHVLEEDDHRGLPIRKHWGQLTQLMKTWLINFRNLDMHVMFIAQVRRLDEEDLNDDETYTRVPMMSPAVRGALGAGVDIIGYTFHKQIEKEVKGKTITRTSYRMRIGPHEEILTKVRVPKGVKYPALLEDPTFDKLFEISQRIGGEE